METSTDKVTPYDEFSFPIPEEQYPRLGIWARTAAALGRQ